MWNIDNKIWQCAKGTVNGVFVSCIWIKRNVGYEYEVWAEGKGGAACLRSTQSPRRHDGVPSSSFA